MTTLYISHIETHTDDLGRFVTTLTQEVMVKINIHEEQIFINTLHELDDEDECIEYHNEDCTELDVLGIAINKAISTVNSIAGIKLIAPVTEIHNGWLYRVELEY